MTHCTYRSRVRVGHQTATGPVTPTCSWDRWGRAETERTALGEALVMRRRTRVRFPPPPPPGSWRDARPTVGEEPVATAESGGNGLFVVNRAVRLRLVSPEPDLAGRRHADRATGRPLRRRPVDVLLVGAADRRGRSPRTVPHPSGAASVGRWSWSRWNGSRRV